MSELDPLITAASELAGTEAGAAVAEYLPAWAKDIGKFLVGVTAVEGIRYGVNSWGGIGPDKNFQSKKRPRPPDDEDDPDLTQPVNLTPVDYDLVDEPDGFEDVVPIKRKGIHF